MLRAVPRSTKQLLREDVLILVVLALASCGLVAVLLAVQMTIAPIRFFWALHSELAGTLGPG